MSIYFRSTLQRAINEPVSLAALGFAMPTKLPESFVTEILLISDMFDLSENAALTLLKSAEEEKTLYPGIPRGLVAVLFYYDSREQLANAFKTLVQAREGMSWSLMPANEDLSATITRFLDPVLNISLLDRILELISSMDITKEVEMLQRNRALGDAKHRKMVLDKFKSVRSLLAETLFCWAAQTPLKKDECRRLLAYLSKVKLKETADGSIHEVDLTILLALLYSIESSHLLNIEDMTEAMSLFPITSDNTFIPEIHKEIDNDKSWETPGLKSVIQLAWAVSLSNLREVASNIQQIGDLETYYEKDEHILDLALNNQVFEFIEKHIFVQSNFPMDTFYCQRFHNIFSDLIFRMPEKIKFMKMKAEENARIIMNNTREGLQPPNNLVKPYEDLLCCLATLYKSGQCGDLVEEYWSENQPTLGLLRGQGSRQMALYKFVRLPGDFLPPSLFVPYINFLTSLATTPKAAQSIYSFLRVNCQPASQGSNLSWDHFLNALSQYYHSLRIETPTSANATVYRSSRNSGPRAITPQEMNGIICVLNLLAQVASQDEYARVALSDATTLSPILISAGLLTCNVPLGLKTCLVHVLASFASAGSTSALAVKVWQALESAGVVPARDGTSGYTNRGIRQDIEEIESSYEEFPLSRAILKLWLYLVKAGIPVQLSKVAQGSSFRPYFDVVKEQIFLPHDSRSYKQGSERWAVARGCMELFNQLLSGYYPPERTSSGETISHPAHILLLDLLHDSQLLLQILSVLHNGVKLLNQHVELTGQSDLHATLLLILEIMEKALHFQRETMLNESGGELLLIGLDKMLQAMNPHSGSCDHMLNIASFINHHVCLPKHATLSCKLITKVGSTPSGQAHLLPQLATNSSVSISVRQSLVQILDHSTLGEEHLEAANAALAMLKSFLQLPAPTYAHYLLGFLDGNSLSSNELRKDLLEPGVRGFPRTMLHALLGAFPTLPISMLETAYHLIHALASNPNTSAATLRYLSSREFIRRSMIALPITKGDTAAHLMSTGWMLHIAALDLKYHASHQQRSQLRRLIYLLVSGCDPESENSMDHLDSSLAWGNTSMQTSRGTILTLLDMSELSVDIPGAPQCQFVTQASEVVKSHEETVNGIKEINIQKLHQTLMHSLQQSGAATPLAQKDPLDSEVKSILDYAVAMNQARKSLAAQCHFLEAWRQLVEIVVAVTPVEVSETPNHCTFLHTLTLELTRRLLDESALPQLTTILVSTLLLLVTTLRTIHGGARITQSSNYVPSLDGDGFQLPASLQLVLRGLVDCVVRFKHSSQSVRASVYAALLNYLHIHADSKSISQPLSQSLLIAPRESQEEQFHRENYEAVRDDLAQLLDVLSCEAAAGHHVCRVLALTCLDALLALERRSSSLTPTFASESPILSYFIDHGHLRRLLDGIMLDDRQLVQQITEGTQDLRPLYVWESRASLLSRIGLTTAGARALLQAGVIIKLSEMKIYQYHPDDPVVPETSDHFNTCVVQIYGGAISGALQICISILTALGPQDFSAAQQVLQFLAAHIDAVTEAMRLPSSYQPSTLHQLSLLTAVVSVAAPITAHADPRDPVAIEAEAQARRLHKQLLNLLPHFLPESRIGQYINDLPDIDDDGSCIREASRTSFLKVLSNCLCHARDQILNTSQGSKNITLLFHPSLEGGERAKGGLSLGTLISALDQSAQQFSRAREASSHCKTELQDLETAQYDTLLKYVSPTLANAASPPAVRQLAGTYLTGLIQLHSEQEEISAHCVEAAALLLWKHLEYFLVHAPKIASLDDNSRANVIPRSLTSNQSKTLQDSIAASLQEILPRLQQVHSLYSAPSSHVAFLDAAITRIRKLVATR